MNFYEKISDIQFRLKAPKGQYNSFGKYKYRSCEDVLEAVKPLLNEHKLYISISDEIVTVQNRFYVKATVTVSDGENVLATSAFAREEEAKKGMDGSQVTGASSSYARKYALNGLFLLDDTKDADAEEYETESKEKVKNKEQTESKKQLVSKEQLEELKKLCKEANREEAYIAKSMGLKTLEELPEDKFDAVQKKLTDIKLKGAK